MELRDQQETTESPKAVEEALLKETAEKEAQVSATSEDLAAVLFRLYGPKFYMGIDRLSLKALRRVIKKLVTHPLNTKEFKSQSNTESEVFGIGDRLLEAKYVMIMGTYSRSADINKALEVKTEELNNEQGEGKDEQTLGTQDDRVSGQVDGSEQAELHQVQAEGS